VGEPSCYRDAGDVRCLCSLTSSLVYSRTPFLFALSFESQVPDDLVLCAHQTPFLFALSFELQVPDDLVLATQEAKRRCWDSRGADAEGEQTSPPAGTIGSGCHGDGRFDAHADLDSFTVAPSMLRRTPALALYDPETQRGRVVFRTRRALLTREECRRVCDVVDEHHRTKREGGEWSTVRRATVPTTDVAVEDIAALRPWLRELLDTRLFPMLDAAFPCLADGTSLVDPTTGSSRVRVHDAFIVRYAALPFLFRAFCSRVSACVLL